MEEDVETIADEDTVRTYESDETERTSTAVVNAVANVRNRDPTAFAPLHERIDVDALDSLFDETVDGDARPDGHVVFEFGGCTVAVFSDGRVLVSENENA